jgi:hypothetical protein
MYILDLKTKLFEFAPVANGCLLGVTGGAVFFDSNLRTHIAYQTTTPAKKVIGHLDDAAPASSYVIQEAGTGNTNKVAEGLKAKLELNSKDYDRRPITFDVSVKVSSLKNPTWGYGLTNNASSSLGQLRVDGTQSGLNDAEVGDEITILEGVNAGQVRHITAIANQNTNTETWTLDTALSSLTENAVRVQVSPFKLASKKSLTSLAKLRDLYFNVSKKQQGKSYLIKTVFENVGSSVPELQQEDFIYDDLGEL